MKAAKETSATRLQCGGIEMSLFSTASDGVDHAHNPGIGHFFITIERDTLNCVSLAEGFARGPHRLALTGAVTSLHDWIMCLCISGRSRMERKLIRYGKWFGQADFKFFKLCYRKLTIL